MATHSSTLAWKIPWTEEPGGCSLWGYEELDMTERLHFHFSLSCIGEGNGNPLQCSCLENPRDGGSWWAAIYGVTQSRTRLKWLSSSSSRRHKRDGFNLWVRKIPWSRKWQLASEFLPENSIDRGLWWAGKELDMTEGLSTRHTLVLYWIWDYYHQ